MSHNVSNNVAQPTWCLYGDVYVSSLRGALLFYVPAVLMTKHHKPNRTLTIIAFFELHSAAHIASVVEVAHWQCLPVAPRPAR